MWDRFDAFMGSKFAFYTVFSRPSTTMLIQVNTVMLLILGRIKDSQINVMFHY